MNLFTILFTPGMCFNGTIIKRPTNITINVQISDEANEPTYGDMVAYTADVSALINFSIRYTPKTADPIVLIYICTRVLLIFFDAYFTRRYAAMAGIEIKLLKKVSDCAKSVIPFTITQ